MPLGMVWEQLSTESVVDRQFPDGEEAVGIHRDAEDTGFGWVVGALERARGANQRTVVDQQPLPEVGTLY